MQTWKKISIGAGISVLAAIGAWIVFDQSAKGVVVVQTVPVSRENLTARVVSSGEIQPRTYSNVMAEGFGKITDIDVKEGDLVKKGDVLMRLENIQPAADVAAQRASVDSADAAVNSADANAVSAEADIEQKKADLEHSELEWERGQELYKEGLIAKQDYDTDKATYDSSVAALAASRARLEQARADLARARYVIAQNQAVLTHTADILKKTTYQAPIGGMVTYIAVRVGENVVPGIQNATGSYLMTISDMSEITSEVMVDETDIINVKPGQAADVTIDALPGKVFQGLVAEVGTQAVLRSSGLASTQSTTGNQEAKDFKVVVTLKDPPAGLRPGLSTTAKITTAEKQNVLAIPMQALAVRTRRELFEAGQKDPAGVTLAASRPAGAGEEVQGVFIVRDNKATFLPVETGIAGVSDIEITSGVNEGDRIVSGSYKALRTMLPTAAVKVDNSAPRTAN
jgi:HlyD family secretion protein